MDPLLTPAEVSERLRVETDTLRTWRWRGMGPEFVKVGRTVRYPQTAVEAFLEESKVAQA